MYQPRQFKETQLDVLHDLIRAHPLGLLISNGEDGPSPIPYPSCWMPAEASAASCAPISPRQIRNGR